MTEKEKNSKYQGKGIIIFRKFKIYFVRQNQTILVFWVSLIANNWSIKFGIDPK